MKIKKQKKDIMDFFESIKGTGVNVVRHTGHEEDLVYKIIFYGCFTINNYRRNMDKYSLRISRCTVLKNPFIEEDDRNNKFNVDFGTWTTSDNYLNLDLAQLYKEYNFDEYSHILRRFEPNNN